MEFMKQSFPGNYLTLSLWFQGMFGELSGEKKKKRKKDGQGAACP